MTAPSAEGPPASDGGRAYVLKQLRDHDVAFLRLWFTDLLGTLKSVSVTREGFEEAIENGISFDGASIHGLARSEETDLVARPDPSTFAVLPWRPSTDRVARVFCNVENHAGEAYAADPRCILQRQVERARSLGYTFYASAEVEFFLLISSEGAPTPVDEDGYFDQSHSDQASELRRDVILTLEQMGIAVDSAHHEGAPGQYEIDLQHVDGLALADAIQTVRYVIKQKAAQHGLYATFMPRPLAGRNGSGMHLGLSLFSEGGNAFYDEEDSIGLSVTGRSFVAGLLERARESTLGMCQWVNSFRRLVAGTEAPRYVSWALTNRGDLVRVPARRPGAGDAMRVEMRAPDAGCNAYLALALVLASGLDGIERGLTPPEPVARNVEEMSKAERSEAGIKRLPEDLGEAIVRAERSTFLAEILGAQTLELLLENKRTEWEAYRAHVGDWELRRYLRVL